MTTAGVGGTPSAVDLLFGPDADAAETLAGEILSPGGDQNLGRALAALPEMTRKAAAQEAATTAAALLKVDLVGVLVRGWREHRDVVSAARRTLAAPGSAELVSMSSHEVTLDQRPSVSVLVDGQRVATLELGLSIVFGVNALLLGISGGRLTGVRSGRCDITATLAVQGTDLLVRRAHLELPGIVSSRWGIRLLPADEYPAGAPRTENADDESAQLRVRTRGNAEEDAAAARRPLGSYPAGAPRTENADDESAQPWWRAREDAEEDAAAVRRPRLRGLRLPNWRWRFLSRKRAHSARSRQQMAMASDVRAVPDVSRPDVVSVRETGAAGTNAVRVEPSPGVTHITTVEETPAGDGPGGGGGAGPEVTGLPPVRRYLLGRFPDTVRPGQIFSLLVSVVRSGGAPLKPFEVPAGGRLLALIIDAPGLRVLEDHRQAVLVPPGGDSEPVKFDLVGDDPGPRKVSVTAWDGGTYLGELAVEVSVERDGQPRPDRTAISEAREETTDGEVTLLVRYDRHQAAYRFEFIDVDYPDEVTSQLVYDPGRAVERLVRRLNALAEGTAGYSAAATRAYLVNEGVQLWQELVPEKLRSQFWERQRRIKQLTILANHDVVPWELLYPKDRRHDEGFLVEQFPVTRAIYGRALQRRLRLQPARFVVPPGSPSDAKAEAEVLARLLGTKLTTVSELMPLLQLIGKGRFGLLHFACHNRFDPDDGSSIRLDSPFSPTFLATAASDQTLVRAAPVVFINACRSLGQVPSYNKLDGWAEKFMRAGAAAFIGSLWEVSDGMAREFAQELYKHLVDGEPLGKAVMAGRRAVAAEPADPTWLAYAVYGDPQAKIELAAQ
jgi:CHAT domain-containing protein